MQAELELQIATVIREVDGANTLGASTLAVYIARALLSQYVLCNAEPVAWMTRIETVGPGWGKEYYDKLPVRAMNPMTYSHHPLYAPASPLGNASIAGNADSGKEGGK
jgi:hypothetical protein